MYRITIDSKGLATSSFPVAIRPPQPGALPASLGSIEAQDIDMENSTGGTFVQLLHDSSAGSWLVCGHLFQHIHVVLRYIVELS